MQYLGLEQPLYNYEGEHRGPARGMDLEADEVAEVSWPADLWTAQLPGDRAHAPVAFVLQWSTGQPGMWQGCGIGVSE